MKGFVRKLLNGPRHLSFPHVARSNSVVNARNGRPSGRGEVESQWQWVSDSVAASPRNLAGRSASSFTKHRVGAYIRSTVYVDIISCWSLLYGAYGGGGGGSKNMFVQ